MKRMLMVGLGYIGLPTAILAAKSGYQVVGFDIDKKKIDLINAGKAPFIEKGLEKELLAVVSSGKLSASTLPQAAQYIVIAVPTPFKDGKKADLSYVYAAAQAIALHLQKGNVVILESTIPVGTTEKVAKFLEDETGMKAGKDFYIAHCPERVLPGKIFEELVSNDRVIGGICNASSQQAAMFYMAFVQGKLYLTDDKTAEMVKLVENSSRDVEIAFANQVAAMSKEAGINPYDVIALANKHPRVNILSPGCGVGGHCIAVDPWFLIESFPEQARLLAAARNVNDNKPLHVASEVIEAAQQFKTKHGRDPIIGLFGLTYKADVDDLRESPALKIAQELMLTQSKNLFVCEPHVESNALQRYGNFTPASLEQIVHNVDIVVILVKHTVFKSLTVAKLETKIIIDPVGLFYKDTTQSDPLEYQLPEQSIEQKEYQ